MLTQPRSHTSPAKIEVTSPVNLIGNFASLSRLVPSLWLVARFARIARVGLGTRLMFTDSSFFFVQQRNPIEAASYVCASQGFMGLYIIFLNGRLAIGHVRYVSPRREGSTPSGGRVVAGWNFGASLESASFFSFWSLFDILFHKWY